VGNPDLVGDVPRLIVFDLDGTLVDSRRDLANSANALIRERGGRALAEEAIGRMVGEGAAVLVRRALTAAGLPMDDASVARFLELYDERLLDTTIAYEGIPEVLDQLSADGTIAVLTNKPLAPSLRILEALGLSRTIAHTIGGDSEFGRKPEPAALRHLMAMFGVDPRATVMVGDSWIDYDTARRAGVAVCLARYGFGYHAVPVASLRGDEGLVDHPSAYPQVIRALLGIS
jgi:phosphoglycolate phosphatase